MDVFCECLSGVIKSGKYFVGIKETLKAVRNGAAILVIIAGDTSVGLKTDVEKKAKKGKVEALVFAGSMKELGRACGKSFKVSCMAITDPTAAAVICAMVDGA
ncbi:60S ribosomal protein L30-like [Drosophila pseudoobscura]|uniref:60S ribosomal protein L30-like n=1 Tax=Drosophila pseudoobscura pseudoobscura TaxID=46245 RepID=B5DL15_DROPS|nr:60S ribosomal protein L30 [Drosophila pseudoobscura]